MIAYTHPKFIGAPLFTGFSKSVNSTWPPFTLGEKIFARPVNDFYTLYKEREKVLSELRTSLEEEGFNVHLFRKATIDEILEAIIHKGVVEGINITEKMQDQNFRFMTAHNTAHTLKISHAMAAFRKNSESMEKQKASLEGVKKRGENADAFAEKMFEIVHKIKAEQKISTYKDTVAALNREKIETYQGKEWHVSALQNLNERWKKLGLITPTPK